MPEAVFAELPDDLDDKPAVLEALRRLSKKAYQGPLVLDETLREESLQEVVAWISDKANWSNHNVEGVCIRKGKTPLRMTRCDNCDNTKILRARSILTGY